jgi:hypothetical protein
MTKTLGDILDELPKNRRDKIEDRANVFLGDVKKIDYISSKFNPNPFDHYAFINEKNMMEHVKDTWERRDRIADGVNRERMEEYKAKVVFLAVKDK